MHTVALPLLAAFALLPAPDRVVPGVRAIFDQNGREVSVEAPASKREDALLLLVLAAVGGEVLLLRSRRPELALP